MGDISNWLSEDLWLTCSVKEFLVKYLAFYKIAGPHISENKETYNREIKRFYDWLSENDIKKIDEYVSLFSLSELAADEVGIFDLFDLRSDGKPTLYGLDGCKIQSYWYSVFNFWLYIMWFCGLRGTVRFKFQADDSDIEFSIDFLEDDVMANEDITGRGGGQDTSIQLFTRKLSIDEPDFYKKVDSLRELKEVFKNGKGCGRG